MRVYTKEQALQRVAALCSKAEKCVFDIEKKLYQWGMDQDDVDAIIERLLEEKFIDQERFVRYYVKDKLTFNGWGKQKVWFNLQQKHISSDLFQMVWEEMDKEQYNEQLVRLLLKKRRSLKSVNPWEEKQKLMRYAAGRGFQIDEIYRALDVVAAEDDAAGADGEV
ncbi:RecX family transcriptional regulator [Halosquirtibacter xylanolyticus]|uniref:regulatory protein RecX n=1 Tax=Halosquirtibacter xylanolyticus TaxID=3374599 RepID=UPI0037490E81|nr:RecX family transcriptional regulator [Prolixibacteraceae bacterium]